jgi:DNA invertase Pin-like site-specific DNA recombinase
MPSTTGHGSKRAILYGRVSTDEQARSGYSLAQQLDGLISTARGLLEMSATLEAARARGGQPWLPRPQLKPPA